MYERLQSLNWSALCIWQGWTSFSTVSITSPPPSTICSISSITCFSTRVISLGRTSLENICEECFWLYFGGVRKLVAFYTCLPTLLLPDIHYASHLELGPCRDRRGDAQMSNCKVNMIITAVLVHLIWVTIPIDSGELHNSSRTFFEIIGEHRLHHVTSDKYKISDKVFHWFPLYLVMRRGLCAARVPSSSWKRMSENNPPFKQISLSKSPSFWWKF